MAEESTQQPGRKQTPGRTLAPRSGVWEHFTRSADKAECKRCGKQLSAKHGTTSLSKHVKICSRHGQAVDAAARAAGPGTGGSSPGLEVDEASKHLARLVALRGWDPSLVDDDCFKSFVGSLNPEFRVPSRVAVESMCDEIVGEARRDFLSRQSRTASGRASFAVGRAKTMEAGEVVYVACRFIDDEWNLRSLVLDARLLHNYNPHHRLIYGPVLGVPVLDEDDVSFERFWDVIFEHGIEDRLYMVARDTDHIVPNADDIDCVYFVDRALHSTAECLLPRYMVIDELIWNVQDLGLTRQERQQLLSQPGPDYQELASDEKWYPYYCCLRMLGNYIPSSSTTEDLDRLMCKLLGGVSRAIQAISASSCPTSNLCLPELFKLREILQSEVARADTYGELDDCFHPVGVASVLTEAKDILEDAIEDSYLVWSIPLALDPRYKLKRIQIIFGEVFGSGAPKRVSEVMSMIKGLYTYHGGIGGADHSDAASAAAPSADPLQQDAMATGSGDSRPERKTELDRYLEDSLVDPDKQDFDILKWWKDHSSDYPTVARMARDALATPTCNKLSSQQMAELKSILRGYSKLKSILRGYCKRG